MTATPEFSRPLAVEGIMPDKPRKESLAATPGECAALAQRLDLRELSGLKADLEIRRVAGDASAVRISGNFRAEVVQACVVSLRDVHAMIEGSFETFFSEKKPADDPEIEVPIDENADSAEMIVNGKVDLGEVVAQYLSLELDPYPRAPGVALPAQLTGSGTTERRNPFEILAGIKKDET